MLLADHSSILGSSPLENFKVFHELYRYLNMKNYVQKIVLWYYKIGMLLPWYRDFLALNPNSFDIPLIAHINPFLKKYLR